MKLFPRILSAALLSLAFASSAVAAFSTADEYRLWLEDEWYSDASYQLVLDGQIKGPYGQSYYFEHQLDGSLVGNSQVKIVADANGNILYVEGPQLEDPLEVLLSFEDALEYAEALLTDPSGDGELRHWYDEESTTVYPVYEIAGVEDGGPLPIPAKTRVRVSAHDGAIITYDPPFHVSFPPSSPFDHWPRIGWTLVETPFGFIHDLDFPWIYRFGEGWLYGVWGEDSLDIPDSFVVWSPVLGWTYWFVDYPDYEYSFQYGWVWRSADRAWVYVLEQDAWVYAAS